MRICREREREIQKMRNTERHTDIDTSPIVEISEIVDTSEIFNM